jgi:hypothetical protein
MFLPRASRLQGYSQVMIESTAKPVLARLLELVAAVMGVGSGRLEFAFLDGRLTSWSVRDEIRSPAELAEFDDPADVLVRRGVVAS